MVVVLLLQSRSLSPLFPSSPPDLHCLASLSLVSRLPCPPSVAVWQSLRQSPLPPSPPDRSSLLPNERGVHASSRSLPSDQRSREGKMNGRMRGTRREEEEAGKVEERRIEIVSRCDCCCRRSARGWLPLALLMTQKVLLLSSPFVLTCMFM